MPGAERPQLRPTGEPPAAAARHGNWARKAPARQALGCSIMLPVSGPGFRDRFWAGFGQIANANGPHPVPNYPGLRPGQFGTGFWSVQNRPQTGPKIIFGSSQGWGWFYGPLGHSPPSKRTCHVPFSRPLGRALRETWVFRFCAPDPGAPGNPGGPPRPCDGILAVSVPADGPNIGPKPAPM